MTLPKAIVLFLLSGAITGMDGADISSRKPLSEVVVLFDMDDTLITTTKFWAAQKKSAEKRARREGEWAEKWCDNWGKTADEVIAKGDINGLDKHMMKIAAKLDHKIDEKLRILEEQGAELHIVTNHYQFPCFETDSRGKSTAGTNLKRLAKFFPKILNRFIGEDWWRAYEAESNGKYVHDPEGPKGKRFHLPEHDKSEKQAPDPAHARIQATSKYTRYRDIIANAETRRKRIFVAVGDNWRDVEPLQKLPHTGEAEGWTLKPSTVLRGIQYTEPIKSHTQRLTCAADFLADLIACVTTKIETFPQQYNDAEVGETVLEQVVPCIDDECLNNLHYVVAEQMDLMSLFPKLMTCPAFDRLTCTDTVDERKMRQVVMSYSNIENIHNMIVLQTVSADRCGQDATR